MGQDDYTRFINLGKITRIVKAFFIDVFEKDSTVTAVIPNETGWKAIAEIILDAEYTQKFAKNDLIHVFEVVLDNKGNIISYERLAIRERGETEEQRGGR